MSGVLKTVRRGEPPSIHMTPRMREVLSLRATGLRMKEIADEMKVTDKTIQGHWSRLVEFFHESDPVAMINLEMAKKHIRRYWTWPAFYHSELIRLLCVSLFAVAFCVYAVQPRPAASFTTGPIVGYAPLTVNFTNTTTGQVQSQTMSFGTGAYLLTNWKTATYHYTEPGSFNATLTVKGKAGSTSYSTLITVTNKPAIASVTLAWTPSTATNVSFYSVAMGFSSRNYSAIFQTPGTNYTLGNLVHGTTYFFNVDCTDKQGLESAFDGEVSYTP